MIKGENHSPCLGQGESVFSMSGTGIAEPSVAEVAAWKLTHPHSAFLLIENGQRWWG
jgi:hypothetical protein